MQLNTPRARGGAPTLWPKLGWPNQLLHSELDVPHNSQPLHKWFLWPVTPHGPSVDLSKNFLVGEIPAKVALLSNLSVLRLSWNNLAGTIPPILGNTTNMQRLGLAYNNLTGHIPDELGKLTNMWRLNLGGNMLSGGFPWCLFNLSKSLQILIRLGVKYAKQYTTT